MLKTFHYLLPDIGCAGCVPPYKFFLAQKKEQMPHFIKGFSIDIISKQMLVLVEDLEGIDEADFHQSLMDEMQQEDLNCSHLPELPNLVPDEALLEVPPKAPQFLNIPFFQRLSWHLILAISGIFSAFILLILSIAFPFWPSSMMAIATFASIGLTLILGAQSYYQAGKSLFSSGRLNMEALFAISTIVIMSISFLSLFVTGLPMLLDASLFILGFRHLGFFIEEQVKVATSVNLRFQDRVQKKARKIHVNGEIEAVFVDALEPGDCILIAPDEIFPVDGTIMEPGIWVNDEIISGKKEAHELPDGALIYAGMILKNQEKTALMQVKATLAQSHLAALDERIALANLEKSNIETFTDKVLEYFIWTVLSIALVSAVIIGCFYPISVAAQVAAMLLVSACPCTLGLIIPLSVKIGMVKASEQGVQFKSSKKMQEANDITSICFDLNGTLTYGKPMVQSSDMPKAYLHYVAVMMRHSKHRFAQSIQNYLEKFHGPHLDDEEIVLNEQQIKQTGGLQATIDGHEILIGNSFLMAGIDLPLIECLEDQTVVYFVMDGVYKGHFILADALRADAKAVVAALQRLGKKIHMVTGSDQKTAERYAFQLGIDCQQIKASCKPEDKEKYIRHLKNEGERVCFVGDGSNDALPISVSDFSLAIEGGDEITAHQAGAIIRGDSLLPVLSAHVIADKVKTSIHRGLLINFIYNFIAMFLPSFLLVTTGVLLNPALGAFIMLFQAAVVYFNVYALYQEDTHIDVLEPVMPISSHQRMAEADLLARAEADQDANLELNEALDGDLNPNPHPRLAAPRLIPQRFFVQNFQEPQDPYPLPKFSRP